jgi:hypothetical protein
LEAFKVNLGVVLEGYPDEVIDFVTHPKTGIQRRNAFPPAISEVVSACEEAVAHTQRAKKHAPVPVSGRLEAYQIDHAPGALAQVHVPEAHPRYRGLVEWSKTADVRHWLFCRSSDNVPGIKVPYPVWINGAQRSSA